MKIVHPYHNFIMVSSSHIFTRLGFKGVTSLKYLNKKLHSLKKPNFPKRNVFFLLKYSDIGSIEYFVLFLKYLFEAPNRNMVEYAQI